MGIVLCEGGETRDRDMGMVSLMGMGVVGVAVVTLGDIMIATRRGWWTRSGMGFVGGWARIRRIRGVTLRAV